MVEATHLLKIDADQLSKRLLLLLVGFELFFVLLDFVVNYSEVIEYTSIHRLCNIAREDGLAGWFMTSQTLVAALVLWLLYWLSRNREEPNTFHRRGWLVLALFFTYMSADDGALIHERIGTMFERMMEKSGKAGDVGIVAQWLEMFPSYEWQFLLPFFALIGLYVLYFLWKVLGIGRPMLMVLAAFSCFTIAVVLDFIEGMEADHPVNVYSWLKQAYLLEDYTVDHFAKVLEEFLEMLGISLFLAVFVAQLGRVLPEVFSIQFSTLNRTGK
jgi:hypothetical protein